MIVFHNINWKGTWCIPKQCICSGDNCYHSINNWHVEINVYDLKKSYSKYIYGVNNYMLGKYSKIKIVYFIILYIVLGPPIICQIWGHFKIIYFHYNLCNYEVICTMHIVMILISNMWVKFGYIVSWDY